MNKKIWALIILNAIIVPYALGMIFALAGDLYNTMEAPFTLTYFWRSTMFDECKKRGGSDQECWVYAKLDYPMRAINSDQFQGLIP